MPSRFSNSVILFALVLGFPPNALPVQDSGPAILSPGDENTRYPLGNIDVTGATLFDPEELVAMMGLVRGEIFNETLLRNGLESLRESYGSQGYINFVPVVTYDFDEDNNLVHLRINLQEGRQFSVGQINFRGNMRTRDKVLRRELLLEEGQLFNSQLWDASLLRLNLLGYFEPIGEDLVEIQPAGVEGVVDITLTVQERDPNFIGATGGVSPIGGGYGGLTYETTNFRGLGQTFGANVQVGRPTRFDVSFSEPYLMDRPVSVGFRAFSIQSQFEDSLSFDQNQKGFSVFTSYRIRTFHRIGLSFEFDDSEASTPGDFFDHVRQTEDPRVPIRTKSGLINFRTPSLSPFYSWSTLDIRNPSDGQNLRASFQFSGGFLGGNVNHVQPSLEYQFFKTVNGGRHTLALRFQAAHVQGFASTAAPFFRRFFAGGDFDIRGFDFRSISPVAFVERESAHDFSPQPKIIDDIAFVGGDTMSVVNAEYRIPLIGNTLTLVPFLDAGNSWVTRKGQLRREVRQPDGATQVKKVELLPGTNSGLRASTGVELQIMLPVIQTPLRLIYAVNPARLDRVVASPNTGQEFLLREKARDFKITVGRTF